ncbi:hypothetical protein PENSPDRAFT_671561 [Peniophora sp. CONT]|nr:hypothetical protein PENSPDRAFT_671561 [Peniophora sp. CONT]
MTITPYGVIQPGAPMSPPILCYLQWESLWVNYDILRILDIYLQFAHACTTNDKKDWTTFWFASIAKRPLLGKYPALWTPLIAIVHLSIYESCNADKARGKLPTIDSLRMAYHKFKVRDRLLGELETTMFDHLTMQQRLCAMVYDEGLGPDLQELEVG